MTLHTSAPLTAHAYTGQPSAPELTIVQHSIEAVDGERYTWSSVQPYPDVAVVSDQLFSDSSELATWIDPEGRRWVVLGSPPVVLYRVVSKALLGLSWLAVKHATFARKVSVNG